MHRVGSISLIMENIDTQKLGEFLDSEGIAVRANNHLNEKTSIAQESIRRSF